MNGLLTRRHVLGGLGVLVTMPWAVAQAAETLKVQDNTGEVSVPRRPKTVLVFDLGALDIIQSLGGERDATGGRRAEALGHVPLCSAGPRRCGGSTGPPPWTVRTASVTCSAVEKPSTILPSAGQRQSPDITAVLLF